MHFDHFAWIGDEISCDSLQISWGQCPRVPGKKNTLHLGPHVGRGCYEERADQGGP
jgi:hypothetical protein